MKRNIKFIASIVLCMALLFTSMASFAVSAADEPVPSVISVQKIEGISDDFMNGVDISSVLSLEESGVKFYNKQGKEDDLLRILAAAGINYVRIRIWNDPWDAQGRGYGGGNCDTARAAIISKRAAAAGIKVLLNYHYSDFWADPGKQMVPKAWTGFTVAQKADAIYAFTKQSVQYIIDQGGDVGMVQIGNETNGSICGVSSSGTGGAANYTSLIKAGSRAVREIDPNIIVAVHISDPQRSGAYAAFTKMLFDNGVDYDLFGSSYYPFWHGTIANLVTQLKHIADTYDKKVAVFETSYMWTTNNGDGWSNTGSATAPYTPASVQTQATFMKDIIQGVVDVGEKGVGVFVWEPAWIPVGTNTAANRLLWEAHGSGWAASYATEYDPSDAGRWFGGCDCEHRAFFDYSGRPLPTLDIFNLVKTGTTKVQAQATTISATATEGNVTIPATVDVTCSDGGTIPMIVDWTQANVNAALAGGLGTYTINGFAGRATGRIASGTNTDAIAAGVAVTLTLTVEAGEKISVQSGESVSVPILLKNCQDVAGIQGSIQFDEDVFTLESILGKDGFAFYSTGKSFAAVTQSGAGVNGDTILGYAILKAKAGLADDITSVVSFPKATAKIVNSDGVTLDQLISSVSVTVLGEPPLIGDVTLDGVVDLADAITLMQYLSGNINLSAKQLKAAEVSKDGIVNVGDVIIIMQLCLDA